MLIFLDASSRSPQGPGWDRQVVEMEDKSSDPHRAMNLERNACWVFPGGSGRHATEGCMAEGHLGRGSCGRVMNPQGSGLEAKIG